MRDMVKCARLIEILCGIHNFIIRHGNEEIEEPELEQNPDLVVQQPMDESVEMQTRDRILQNYFF